MEKDMESRTPSIIDLTAELAKLTMFRGRTPQSTMADRKGSGGRLAPYRDGALFKTRDMDAEEFLAGIQIADLEAEQIVDADVAAIAGGVGGEGTDDGAEGAIGTTLLNPCPQSETR